MISGFRVPGVGFRLQTQGPRFRVQDFGLIFQDSGSGILGSECMFPKLELRVQGLGHRFRHQGSEVGVLDSGFRIQGSGFRVQDSGFRDQGPGFRIQGSDSESNFQG